MSLILGQSPSPKTPEQLAQQAPSRQISERALSDQSALRLLESLEHARKYGLVR